MKPPYVPGHVRVWKRSLLSVAGVASLGSTSAWADTIDWGNTNGGSFSVGTNWIGGITPGAADSAYFRRTRNANEQAAYTVSFSSSPSNVNLVVDRDRVTLDLNGNAYLLTSLNFAMSIGLASNGSGRLILIDGVVATTTPNSRVTIGAELNAPGFLTLSTGAQLLGASVHVGYAGNGSLVVQNGADLIGGPMFVGSDGFGGITGTATVTGVGSAVVVEDLSVGWVGAGAVNVNSGGRVESTTGTLGRFTGIAGTINIDGASSRWTASEEVYVGYTGPGVLNLTNGGRVQCDDAFVGAFPGSTGAITISGNSQLIVQDRCTIANSGTGSLNVSSGGLIQCAFSDIGTFAPGTATIQDAASRWICSADMSVGSGAGNGTLSISGGAEVSCANGILAKFGGAGSVTLTGEGSRWTMTGDLSVGGNNGQMGGPGSLTIGPGAAVTCANVRLFPAGSVELSGGTLDTNRIFQSSGPGGDLILGSGILHAHQIDMSIQNVGATLAPGRPIGTTSIFGTISIFGDYIQLPDATMEIEIGGTMGTDIDRVLVGGMAILNGTLAVRLVNGFVPSPSQTFLVLGSSRVLGLFPNAPNGSRLAVPGGGSFLVHYGEGSPFNPDQVILSGYSACRADINGDGFVNSQDFFNFLNAFFALSPSADFNVDGSINSQDFFDFLAALFAGC